MTTIIIKRDNEDIICVECSNHTGFADFGKDIVCAGVSSITQTAVLGIKELTNLKHSFKIDEKTGYLKLELFDIEKSSADFCNAQVILKTMLLGIKNLQEQYPKYIKLEDK
jgi:uncharacterized protein YsxB (DUF464 family)